MARQILASVSGAAKGNLYGYALPKGLLPLTINKVGGLFHLETKDVEVVPDPDHQYFFHYQPSAFSSDDLTIQFSEEGFLSSLQISFDDQTGEFISRMGDLGSALASVVSGPMTRSLGEDSEEPELIFAGTIDPFDPVQLQGLNDLLSKHGTGASIESKVLGKREVPAGEDRGQIASGVYCKPWASCELTLKQGNSSTSAVFRMPHPTSLHFIEIPQAPWVKTEVNITFSAVGYPTSIHIVKPSSAMAILKVPIDLLNTLIELPTKLFQFRINLGSSRANAMEAQLANQQRMDDMRAQMSEMQAEREASQTRSLFGGGGNAVGNAGGSGASSRGMDSGGGDPELLLKLQQQIDILTKRDLKRLEEMEALTKQVKPGTSE